MLQPENTYRRLVRVVHFLPDIACSQGESEGQEQSASPQTGKFSHNGHMQACHVQLTPQIFSATVLFSAPLSRKHSCRVIGASLRSLPTVSDGESAITNTLPMRISHGKPSLPVSRLPSPNDLQNSFKNTFQSLCAPNELFSGPRGLGLYPPKGKARRRRRRRPCPPQAPPEALPAAGVRRRVCFGGRARDSIWQLPGPRRGGSQCGPQSSRARPASGWARGDSDSAFPASTNQGRLGGATLWYRDPKRRASPVARS